MAQENLRYAAATVAEMARADPRVWAALVQRIGLEDDEPDVWKRAAEAMFLPYDEALGIIPQDDSFLDKKVWDFEARHPTTTLSSCTTTRWTLPASGHQAGRHGARHVPARPRLLRRRQAKHFDYYDPLTTGDSRFRRASKHLAAEVG